MLALEAAQYNVNVNAIAQGFVGKEGALSRSRHGHVDSMNRKITLGRIGKPDDMLGAVLPLVSDDGNYITGKTVAVTGRLNMR